MTVVISPYTNPFGIKRNHLQFEELLAANLAEKTGSDWNIQKAMRWLEEWNKEQIVTCIDAGHKFFAIKCKEVTTGVLSTNVIVLAKNREEAQQELQGIVEELEEMEYFLEGDIMGPFEDIEEAKAAI